MTEILGVVLRSSELHSRCTRSGRCHSALVSRNSKKEWIVAGLICTVSSGMIAGLVSLDDSRHRAAGVIVTGIMDTVLARSWSAEKHAVWNLRCRKVLSIRFGDHAGRSRDFAIR